MLDVRCEEYLASVREQASEMGLRDKLEQTLDYLATYGCTVSEDGPPTPEDRYGRQDWPTRMDPERCRCVLIADHAPLSFFFHMQRRQPDGSYVTWFCGGMIFHGPGSSGSEFPVLSTRLGDCAKAEWSIHT